MAAHLVLSPKGRRIWAHARMRHRRASFGSEGCSRISDLHDFHDSIRLYHERADPYLNARSSSLQRKNSSLSAVSALEGNGDWGDWAEPLGSTVIGSTEVHAGAGSSSQDPRSQDLNSQF